jgi:hypothetical protein
MNVEQVSIWGALAILAFSIVFVITSPLWGWSLPRHRRLRGSLANLRSFSVPHNTLTSSTDVSVDKIIQNPELSDRVVVIRHLHPTVREFFRSASRQAMVYMLGAFVASAIAFIIIGRLQHDSTFLSSTVVICGLFFAGLEAVLLLVFLGQYHVIATQVDRYEDLFP